MQHGVHLAETRSPVPFLTMTDLVTKAVQTDQRACLGLIGTKLVMFGSTYQTPLGLAGVRVLIPEGEDADSLDSIIFDELLIRSPNQDRSEGCWTSSTDSKTAAATRS